MPLDTVVDGRLTPQARKDGVPGVLLIDGRVADIDRVEWFRQVHVAGKSCSRHDDLRDVRRFRRSLLGADII